MTIWQRWKQTALHNKALVFSSIIMAFGTLFYSGAAIVQVYMFNRSSKQAQQQTEQLIKAANIQACAASKNAEAAASFARSAEGIKNKTGEAVTQFQNLANATKESAGAAKSAADTAKETLVSAQRAFVFTTWDTTTTENKVDKTVTFEFGWENSGTTPTKNFRTHVNYTVLPGDIPIDYTFPDRWGGHPHINFHAVIGPKGKLTVDSGEVPVTVLQLVANKQIRLYFYGWARYRDILPGTPEHVTQFCFELHIPDPDTWTTNFTNCPRHNCYDDECDSEQQ
jgi:hypothetical protein